MSNLVDLIKLNEANFYSPYFLLPENAQHLLARSYAMQSIDDSKVMSEDDLSREFVQLLVNTCSVFNSMNMYADLSNLESTVFGVDKVVSLFSTIIDKIKPPAFLLNPLADRYIARKGFVDLASQLVDLKASVIKIDDFLYELDLAVAEGRKAVTLIDEEGVNSKIASAVTLNMAVKSALPEPSNLELSDELEGSLQLYFFYELLKPVIERSNKSFSNLNGLIERTRKDVGQLISLTVDAINVINFIINNKKSYSFSSEPCFDHNEFLDENTRKFRASVNSGVIEVKLAWDVVQSYLFKIIDLNDKLINSTNRMDFEINSFGMVIEKDISKFIVNNLIKDSCVNMINTQRKHDLESNQRQSKNTHE